jgi:hypothetical protein
MHTTSTTRTDRARTTKALATGVTAAIALTAVAVPGAFARPAEPMHTAALDRALAVRGSTQRSDLRTPDAVDAAASAPRVTATAAPAKVLRSGQSTSNGFDWGDAAIGAGGTVAAITLSASAAMALSRRRGRPTSASNAAGVAL